MVELACRFNFVVAIFWLVPPIASVPPFNNSLAVCEIASLSASVNWAV